jgi:hypothetical protein
MKTRSEYDKEYSEKNRKRISERKRKRYLENKEKILEKRRIYYLNNKEKILENRLNHKEYYDDYNKEYYLNNKEEISENKKEYYLNNKESLIQYSVEYKKKRYVDDPLYKLTQNIRNLIRDSLRKNGYSKKSKTQDILGCNYNEFKCYLESKFEPWMNWSNRGNWNGYPNELNVAWDIDHIIPLSSATTEEEILKLSHYTNLQPLCSYFNRHIKSGKINA